MDRMIYLSMTGAKALMQRQEAVAHNLSNVSTTGFRADVMAFRSVPVRANGTATTRVANLEATAGFDPNPGPMQTTGRPLDVAVRGQGWLAVTGIDGNEAYTRNGAFVVGPDGTLQTHNGYNVVGDGGPIVIPANSQVSIGSDGTITAKTGGQPPVPVGRLKLVDPPVADLHKGPDGLLRLASGEAPADPNVRVADGTLEGSNVNVVEAMVGMITLARQFELQMKMMQTSDSNDQKATQLLSLKG